MTDSLEQPGTTPLGRLVLGGDELAEPVRITDFVYCSPDITNSFRVLTGDGDVVINTGATGSGAKHRRRYAAVSAAPVRYILLTQSHLDHIGGLAELREPGTQVVTQARFPEIFASRRRLAPFWQRRKDRLLKQLLGDRMVSEFVDPIVPDVTFGDTHELSLGGRRFVLISTPGGETLDSMVVWLPQDRILFSGNTFGPIAGDLPNLYTIRGERIRSALGFVQTVNRLLDLEPELVIQGHGSSTGLDAATFRSKASRVRDAVQWLHDATVEGMNAGSSLHELMRTLTLPPELDVPTHHGKVSWCVRAIWEEYVGWFRFESTTELYDVGPSSVQPELVALAGGASVVAERARARLQADRPLEALHLVEAALAAEPRNRAAIEVELAAHERLLEQSGSVNFFETLWLQSCIADARRRLENL